MTKKLKTGQQTLSAILMIAAIILLGLLSHRYKLELDWTAGHRNTLTEASRKQLASMHDPLKFTAFLYAGADNRKDVESWIARYQRFKPDIQVDYIDPQAHPEKVRDYNVESAGETVVEYEGRRETLRSFSEQSITGALQRLSYSGERYVVFLTGHGEHGLEPGPGAGGDGPTTTSYAQFAQVLQDKGIKTLALNLAKTPSIPGNASALVIAAPKDQLLDGEVKVIKDYVAAGGNLLWLSDPQSADIPELAKVLGVNWQKGVAIFPDSQAGNPAIFVATAYPVQSPVSGTIDEISVFPLVHSLTTDAGVEAAAGWTVMPMLVSNEAAWLKTGKLDGPIDPAPTADDIKGPLMIGVSLTRMLPAIADKTAPPPADPAKPADKPADRQQRVALVGDADFLGDATLSAYGNRQLGLNLVQWLSTRDGQLDIDVPKAPDTNLYLPGWAVWLIAGGFTLLLPALLLAYGIGRWLVRRRA